jgi:hypothetical protein
MKVEISMQCMARGVAAIALAGMLAVSPAHANTYTFFTPSGATTPDGPVSASATFVTGFNEVTVTLTNLLGNPKSVGQAISDILFTAGGLTSGTGNYSPIANYISIAKDGSTKSVSFTDVWHLGNSGGTYHLTTIDCPVSACTGPAGLIIGPGPYTAANGSIAGNKPHNPFVDQSATFTLALAGATKDTVISDVVFSFGTSPGVNVVGVTVPIPAAIWLFVSGLLGLMGIGRRKQRVHGGASSVLPVPISRAAT